jgi:glycosyltransferase involved in cell wall biosynthesis
MDKGKVSIIIPARGGQPYLQSTITGLLNNAREEIEIIVVYSGLWPNPPVLDDSRVIQIHYSTQFGASGMKDSIMKGIAISRGEYIIKTDAHCMFDEGFDVKLKADCEDNWVVIPRRYRLDGDEWKRIDELGDKRPPADYMYLAYPYERPYDKTCGLHGCEDRQRYFDRKDILIDDTMSFQGSCYFMKRSHWDNVIKGFDIDTFGQFTMEAQEIGNRTWYAGGRVVVNKKTWYAHMHKGKRGKQYQFSNAQYRDFGEQNEKGRLAGIRVFISDPHFEELLMKFWPVPTWPLNWKDQLSIDALKDYSVLGYKDDEWLKGLRK